MPRFTVIPLMIFAVLSPISTESTAGSITYNVVNYPIPSQGFTITGTITTNGTTGTAIPVSDITSWNITATQTFSALGPPVMTFTPSNSTIVGTILDPTPTFDATATAIAISGSEFIDFHAPQTFNPNELIWASSPDGFGISAEFSNPNASSSIVLGGLASFGGLVATTVPEPSSAVLGLIGGVTVAATILVRHRWSKRWRTAASHTQSTE